jgi:hypothetical protein
MVVCVHYLAVVAIAGPFVKADKHNPLDWISKFTDHLSDSVVAVGPTINCQHQPHVQSYVIALNTIGLKFALSAWAGGGCDQDGVLDKDKLIKAGEVGLSQAITTFGYSAYALDQDYTHVKFTPTECDHITKVYSMSDNIFTGCCREMFVSSASPELKLRSNLACAGPAASYLASLNPQITTVAHPEAAVFVKYGGEVYRQNLMHPGTKSLVESLSEASDNNFTVIGHG